MSTRNHTGGGPRAPLALQHRPCQTAVCSGCSGSVAGQIARSATLPDVLASPVPYRGHEHACAYWCSGCSGSRGISTPLFSPPLFLLLVCRRERTRYIRYTNALCAGTVPVACQAVMSLAASPVPYRCLASVADVAAAINQTRYSRYRAPLGCVMVTHIDPEVCHSDTINPRGVYLRRYTPPIHGRGISPLPTRGEGGIPSSPYPIPTIGGAS